MSESVYSFLIWLPHCGPGNPHFLLKATATDSAFQVSSHTVAAVIIRKFKSGHAIHSLEWNLGRALGPTVSHQSPLCYLLLVHFNSATVIFFQWCPHLFCLRTFTHAIPSFWNGHSFWSWLAFLSLYVPALEFCLFREAFPYCSVWRRFSCVSLPSVLISFLHSTCLTLEFS